MNYKVKQSTGRAMAQKLYPILKECEMCKNEATDRHHDDGNVFHNERSNIKFLCRRHHMEVDGRLNNLVKKNKQRPKLKLKRACDNCGALRFPLRKGLCHACNEYKRRNGISRPIQEAFDGEVRQICEECQQWFVMVSHHAKYCPDCRRKVYLRRHANSERQRRLKLSCHDAEHGLSNKRGYGV